MIGSSLDSPPPAPPDPERLLKGYRWPASRITKADMMRLTELRRQTGRPITQLLHQAVAAYYMLMQGGDDRRPRPDSVPGTQNHKIESEQDALKIVPYHGEGRSLWYIVNAHAAEEDQPCVLATADSLEKAHILLASLAHPPNAGSAPEPSA